MSNSLIVLAMHGMPPTDFPPKDRAEFFALAGRMAGAAEAEYEKIAGRLSELDHKMRHWPRTPTNDPFYFSSMEVAKVLEAETGLAVLVGFNDFCAPDLPEIFAAAAARKPVEVIVSTPMLIRGGSHAEYDIPQAIEVAMQNHPGIKFRYAWPISEGDVARFLSDQLLANPEKIR